MQRFSGKVVLVTGGNSGLGKTTAEAFAREGAKVVIAARREEPSREVEASIRASGGDATFLRCDITDEEQVRALIDEIVKMHGRLDLAYNNAWAKPNVVPFAELTMSQLDYELSSLRGTFLCMKYEIPAMIAGGGGVVVNCSSLVTKLAQPGIGGYAAAKAALEVLTRTAAHEYAGKNIRVNSICTGAFQTPASDDYVSKLPPEEVKAFFGRIALGRYGKLEELAQTVLFLCSEGAAYITGTNLLVDGGYLLT